jgi:rRNA maturation protein Nop10
MNLLKCTNCGTYTLSKKCKCGAETKEAGYKFKPYKPATSEEESARV